MCGDARFCSDAGEEADIISDVNHDTSREYRCDENLMKRGKSAMRSAGFNSP